MRNKISTYIIITTLVMALLVSTGKATSVFALADPAPEIWISPVYDTTIYQFSDYVENLSDPQYEIFKIALGLYVASQAGASKYQLNDPYTTKDGIVGWFKSLGLTAYNSIIGLLPDYITDPISGGLISTADAKEQIKFLVAYGMGAAVLAANYSTEQDFLDDIDSRTNFFIEYGVNIQPSINNLIAINGGFYNWQFEESEWDNLLFTYNRPSDYEYNRYMSMVNELQHPIIMYHSTYSGYENIVTKYLGDAYLFFNTSNMQLYLCNASGYQLSNQYLSMVYVSNTIARQFNVTAYFPNYSFAADTRPYRVIANDYFTSTSHPLCYLSAYSSNYGVPLYTLFVKGVYYGDSWGNKAEVSNVTDLDLSPNSLPYYMKITDDYLFDIKGYIEDLLNQDDLYDPWINNLHLPSGDIVIDPDLIQVSIDLSPITDLLDPPIPVDLNDVAIYTENDYIEEIKERSRKFGDVIGQYIIFWHNSDPTTCYVFLGGCVVVLLAAFIGKWGHS